MPLIALFVTAFSISSTLAFNSYDNKEIPKYRQVLSVNSPKYKTLEITATPTNKYYFVPTYNERPVYKKLTATSKVTPGSSRPTIPGVMASQARPATWEEGLAPSTNLKKEDFILGEINNYRISKGLPKSQTDPNTCSFAKLRAQEISVNFNHDGFTNRINSNTLPYPSYASITENISMNSDYKMVVPKWIESSSHAENISKDTPFICIGNSGNYYVMEGWKP